MKNLILLIVAVLLVSCQEEEILPNTLMQDFSADMKVRLEGSSLDMSSYPGIIPLPTGFQPEGIAIGPGSSFYVASLPSGRIYKGDLRTGEGEVLVDPPVPTGAAGLFYDARSGYLFVAGGLSGAAFIYDANTGSIVQSYELAVPGTTLINDVFVTREAAFFTDSFYPILYKIPLSQNGRLPDPSEVISLSLTGFSMTPVGLPGFAVPIFANGIVATPSGKMLIIGNLERGEFYRVDPNTGNSLLLDLGGTLIPYNDGLLLDDKKLYVVQNLPNQIAVVTLDNDYQSGRLVEFITDANFGIPATIAEFGNYLYAVNAHFDLAPPPGVFPDVEFEVVRVRK